MKTYNIFVKQNKDNNAVEDVLLIKDGFNIFAFLFTVFWFLFNKLWLFAIISFVIMNIFNFVFSFAVLFVFVFLFSLLIGFEANNLLLYRFQREGYYFVGYTMGKSKKEAELRFLDDINKDAKGEGRVVM